MPKILVADDNSNIQKMVSLAFEDHGIDVVAVGNGEAAVRRLPDLKPDLVLADIFMPVRNGYEVCEFVKKDPRFSQVPVILLVGAFDPLDENEARRVGADGILKKPFVPPDPLIAMVTSALGRCAKPAPAPVPVPEPVAAQVIAVTKPPAVSLAPVLDADEEVDENVYAYGNGRRDLDDKDVRATDAATAVVEEDDAEIAANRDWRHDSRDFEVPENESAAFVSAIADAEDAATPAASTAQQPAIEPATIDLSHEDVAIPEAADSAITAESVAEPAEEAKTSQAISAVSTPDTHTPEPEEPTLKETANPETAEDELATAAELMVETEIADSIRAEQASSTPQNETLEVEPLDSPAEAQTYVAEAYGASDAVAEIGAPAEESHSSATTEPEPVEQFAESTVPEAEHSEQATAESVTPLESAKAELTQPSEQASEEVKRAPAPIEPPKSDAPAPVDHTAHTSGWMDMMTPLPPVEPVSWSSHLEQLLADAHLAAKREGTRPPSHEPVSTQAETAKPSANTHLDAAAATSIFASAHELAGPGSTARPAASNVETEYATAKTTELPEETVHSAEEHNSSHESTAIVTEHEPADIWAPETHEPSFAPTASVPLQQTSTSEKGVTTDSDTEESMAKANVTQSEPAVETNSSPSIGAAELDALISRVVEKLEPRLHEILSNGVLRPLVETVLRKELEKK